MLPEFATKTAFPILRNENEFLFNPKRNEAIK